MSQYFRITAYHPTEDFSVIMDSNGMFEKLWQFSSFVVQRGFKVLEVGNDEKFIDVSIQRVEFDAEHIFLRANAKGKPENIRYEYNGIVYNAICLEDKIYIPNKTQIVT